MNLREQTENFEEIILTKYATKSKYSKGRKKDLTQCDIRTDFQRDRDRIIHSKSFRRLMHKTQVFISPEGDHYRTRLTHTLEVNQVAKTISRALLLNEDLTEAIALGHDLGHTPFGHTGEAVLNELLTEGFRHNEQSLRVVEIIENNGEGLNLTSEVLDGILNHSTTSKPSSLEGAVVQLADKIAYINHDIDDAIRAGVLTYNEIPKSSISLLGKTGSKRIDFLIRNIIENSLDKNKIIMDADVKKEMYNLRKFLFDNVYLSSNQMKEQSKIKQIVKQIFYYYKLNIDKIPEEFGDNGSGNRIIADYIACMTDRYCLNLYSELFLPENIY